ncbi:MAG TPA: hypothetical protein PLV59_01980 [Candidatus Dojkabacteria bacterium]|nr:hypothetical protein [Candidatus Dojkabacteria bacterium]
MKIYLTGSSGSGKTTYAKKLAELTGVSLYSTDDFYNEKDKRMFTLDEIMAVVPIDSDWVIEGAYYIPEYIKAADKVIYIRIGPIKTAWRIVKRWMQNNDLRKKFTLSETLKLVYTTVRDMYISDDVDLNSPEQRHYKERDRYLLCKNNAKVLEVL